VDDHLAEVKEAQIEFKIHKYNLLIIRFLVRIILNMRSFNSYKMFKAMLKLECKFIP